MCDFESMKELQTITKEDHLIQEPETLEQVQKSSRNATPDSKNESQLEIIDQEERVSTVCLLDN